jgi:hypothetical protein
MNRNLLQINIPLAFFTCFIVFEISSMERPNPTNTEYQSISLAIIKAAVERDGDTMKKILDSTPVAERKFCLDFPEYNFGFDQGSSSSFWYKVYKNHFSLVSVGKKLGLVDDAWRMRTETGKLYYVLRFKDSKNKVLEYAIDDCVIKSPSNEPNSGKTTNVVLTRLMVVTYSGDAKGIERELSKRIDHRELIHSLFIAITQNCFDCLELLLSKKEIIKSDSVSNCSLYRTLLQEAGNRKNLNIFEMLIKQDPLNCLNTPARYPLRDESDLTTVLDYCFRQANPSFYLSANEQHEFFKQCAEICKKYGAKTLKELVQEGYVVLRKPESHYDRYEKGYINS